MEMSEEEIITSTRELLASYQALLQVNSSQKPIFIVKHLAKLFDKESGNNISNIIINNNNNSNNLNGNRKEKDYDIIMRIRSAYNEFQDCSDAVRAPNKLVTNLEEILIHDPKEPTTTFTTMDTDSSHELCTRHNIILTDPAPVQTERQNNGTEILALNKDQIIEQKSNTLVNTTSFQQNDTNSIERGQQQKQRRKQNSSQDDYYECPYCLGIFFNKKDLKAHRNFHRQRSFFPCKFCLRSFAQSHSLKFHEHRCVLNLILKPEDQLITMEMALFMSKCFRAPSASTLNSDFTFVKPLPPQSISNSISNGAKKRKMCSLTNSTSPSSSSSSEEMLPYIVRVAINEATGEKRKLYKCSSDPNCNKQFSSKGFLFNHLRFHAEEADKQQNYNIRELDEETDLQEQEKESSEDSSLSSSESDSSSLKSSRRSRAKIHHSSNPSRNSSRKKVFDKSKSGERKSPRKLNRDPDDKGKERKSEGEKPTRKSASSTSVFNLKSPLSPANRQRQRLRQRQNTEKRRARRPNGANCVCSYCGYSCPDQGKLVIHIRVHTGEKPFSCKHCSRGFSNSSNCRVHERLHEKKGSFKRTAGSLLESERTI